MGGKSVCQCGGDSAFRESAWLGSGVVRDLGEGLWYEQRMRQRREANARVGET